MAAQRMQDYINENINTQITLSELAKAEDIHNGILQGFSRNLPVRHLLNILEL
ncbi:hypothetical protein [Pseudobacteroides sp.]|uniref:hypothetical protein n=1 Tax=Pseudobacteroides sp. TaxID=1968840 RepID=UPI002FDCFC86